MTVEIGFRAIDFRSERSENYRSMDREDLRSVLRTTGVDLWTLIETAISVAASDHGAELRLKRDGFVERLYAPPPRSSENDDQIQIELFEAKTL